MYVVSLEVLFWRAQSINGDIHHHHPIIKSKRQTNNSFPKKRIVFITACKQVRESEFNFFHSSQHGLQNYFKNFRSATRSVISPQGRGI